VCHIPSSYDFVVVELVVLELDTMLDNVDTVDVDELLDCVMDVMDAELDCKVPCDDTSLDVDIEVDSDVKLVLLSTMIV